MLVRIRTLIVVLLIFSGSFSVAFANVERLVDVVFVTWQGAKPITPTLSDVRAAVEGDVQQQWKRFTSFEGNNSQDTKFVEFRFGESLAAPISLAGPIGCNGESGTSFMNSIRQEAYKRLSITSFASRYLLIVTPDAGCLWLGRAIVGSFGGGGVVTLQNTASPFVIAHELGHTLGLGHSNLLRCTSGAVDGPWGTDCKAVEYGGTIDIMGNISTQSLLSTYHLWRMGLLEPSEVKQSWLSESIELTAADVSGGTRSIFLRDGDVAYWLEYRRASQENSYRPGLVLYRTDPPPSGAIVSINPEDTQGGSADSQISTDIWMLNLGDYSYTISPTRASGSMTLSEGSQVKTFSGNITLATEPTKNKNSILVKITRQPDVTPPPKPSLTKPDTWRYPESSVITSNYADKDSVVDRYEIKIGNAVQSLVVGSTSEWTATYLNPLTPPKIAKIRYLPEGNYSFQVRSVDIWGNVSEWSDSAKIVIDRGFPTFSDLVDVKASSDSSVSLGLQGASDSGSGLCDSVLTSPQGWIFSRDTAKSAPTFSFNPESVKNGSVRIFDCSGNGIVRDFEFSGLSTQAIKAKRTGSWIPAAKNYPVGSLKCRGKCTASITLSGNQSILVGSGSGEVVANSQQLAKIETKSQDLVRVGAKISLGNQRKVIRIVGRDLVLVGFTSAAMKFSTPRQVALAPSFPDPSLDDPQQKQLAQYGLNTEDLTSEWTVLPMARGTTLQDPTLDLCELEYSSESERIARRQVQATSANSPYSFLSSEVVRYKSASAASQAVKELKNAVETCIKNGGGVAKSGLKVPYTFEKLPSSSLIFVKDENRVFVKALIGSGDSTRWLLGFYQFSGDMFTGLYVVKNARADFTLEEIRVWLDAASRMAQRLAI